MKNRLLVSIISFISISLLVGCSNENKMEEIIEESSSSVEIVEEKVEENFEIMTYWIAEDDNSTLSILPNDKNEKLLILNSTLLKKRSFCEVSNDIITFKSDGIDFFSYNIESDVLRFRYKEIDFVFFKASEEDFDRTNKKIEEKIDANVVINKNDGNKKEDISIPKTLKELIIGYWINEDKTIALIFNDNGMVDITTKGNNIGEPYLVTENTLNIEELGEFEITIENETMTFIKEETICFIFKKYSSIDAFFKDKNEVFNEN